MNKNKLISAFLLLVMFATLQAQNDDRKRVKLTTNFGSMIIELYNETPLHRDNFLKLVEEGFYNDLLFHRVIQSFMIQGGDPDSKTAAEGARLGNGGPGYTIPAEFDTTLVHKKGALAAARLGDNANPKKESSGSQFYIVQGQVIPLAAIDQMEQKTNQRQINTLINQYLQQPENKGKYHLIDSLQKAGNFDAVNAMYRELEGVVKTSDFYKPFKLSKLQREVYSTLGGTPHLDNNYTVFGQVTEGLHIIDSIAAQPTDKADRPLQNITMKMEIIK